MGSILVLADVHSNLRALRAVLADAAAGGGFHEVWLLGDAVGYGPEPNECIELLRQHRLTAVAGNHDAGVLDASLLDRFNPRAAEACRWSARMLSESSRDYLAALPLRRCAGQFLMVHGSPRAPLWDYVLDAGQARRTTASCPQQYVLMGHTHWPALFVTAPGNPNVSRHPGDGETEVLAGRAVINPGSVGQPRDGDPRASYAVLDPVHRSITFHRVHYDIDETMAAMRRAGLPEPLAQRLRAGY